MNILLVCNLGMSSGLLGNKIEAECKKRGVEATVNAVPMNQIDDHLANVDVVLVSPQVRFIVKDVQKKVDPSVVVLAMGPSEFGLQKADVILNNIEKAKQG